MKEVKCTWLLMKDEEEDDEGVDDDIEIDIITKVCTTLPDIRSSNDSSFTRPNRFSQDRKNIVINNDKS
jgi:hypothetical protein